MQTKTTMIRHTTKHQLEWPKSRTLKHQMLGRMLKNFHLLLVGIQNNPATLEDSLEVSYKIKHTLTILSSNHTHYLHKGVENLCPHKNTMFIEVLIITAKTWKQPKDLSVGEWINCGTSRQWKLKKKLAIKP